MNNVLLIVSFPLFCVTTAAMAEDIRCSAAPTPDETAFVTPRTELAVSAAPLSASAVTTKKTIQISTGNSYLANIPALYEHASPAAGFDAKAFLDKKLNTAAVRQAIANAGVGGMGHGIAAMAAIGSGGDLSDGPTVGLGGAVQGSRIGGGVSGGGWKPSHGDDASGGTMGIPPLAADPPVSVGGGPGISGEGFGGVPFGRPSRGATSVTTAPELQPKAVAEQLGQKQLTPAQQAVFDSLGYNTPESQSCTKTVIMDASGAQAHVDSAFGSNAAKASQQWQKYLANPAAYTANDPDHGQVFAAAEAATKVLLQKCFSPATTAPAYTQLSIPKRLGFITVDGLQQCEALLISKDHILTARHCWFDSKETAAAYGTGKAYYASAADSSKRYQICAANSKVEDTSASLDDEQVVMRIASTGSDLPPLEIADPKEIKPFPSDRAPPPDQQVTRLVTFTWIGNSARFNPAFENNLAVGTTPCYVVAYDAPSQCFTNMCMTYEGTSGGAIFTADNAGKWKLLGMHIGAANPDDHKYPACTSTSTNKENAGLVANASLLAKYAK